jgi:hypothetical protein
MDRIVIICSMEYRGLHIKHPYKVLLPIRSQLSLYKSLK